MVAAGVIGAGGATATAAAAPHPNLPRELQGLVRMPDGPPGAIVVVQRGTRRTVSAPACAI